MIMTIENKRRELFEATYLEKYFYSADRWELVPEKYRTQHAEIAWWAFNAALDAVVIQMPQQWNDDGCGAFYKSEGGPHMDSKEVRAAIESTGLGLKVLP